MHPVLLKVGPLTFYGFGTFLALAFCASVVIAYREFSRKGMDPYTAFDLALAAFVGGLAGARLVHVFAHLPEFLENPVRAFAIWEGGLIFYGGLVGGGAAVLLVVRFKRLSVGKVADIIAPCLAIGSAIGRLGCFSRGCCYGLQTGLPWGVTFTDRLAVAPLGVALHPTQLYEFAYNLVILAVLWIVRKRADADGFLFWSYIGLYGLFRFLVEFLRERPIVAVGLGGSQIFSLAMLVAAALVIGLKYAGGRHEIGKQIEA